MKVATDRAGMRVSKMTESVEEVFKETLARWLEKRLGKTNITVLDYEQKAENGSFSGCHTCGYGEDDPEVTVWISYSVDGGRRQHYEYSDDLVWLIKELSSV